MVDPETFSIITRAFLKRKSEEAENILSFMKKIDELEKET